MTAQQVTDALGEMDPAEVARLVEGIALIRRDYGYAPEGLEDAP